MSLTTYGVNDALAVKLWSKSLAAEALKETYFGRFMGPSSKSLIQVKNEVNSGAGDQVTYGLRVQLTGDGVTESQILEGNEEALSTYSDALLINELNHAVRVRAPGTIDQERVPFNLREEARAGLSDWFANRFDTALFNHLCGNTAESRLIYSGNNVITAPTSGTSPATRILRAKALTTDQAVAGDSTAVFDLTLIDKAKEIAKTTSPMIRPIKVDGKDMYVLFLHPSQVTSLRTSTSAGQWLDIQKAAMMGGKVGENPIFTGALGVYNNVVLYEAVRITQGVHSSTGATVANTRRAVFAGAQAGVVGFGSKSNASGQRFNWVEKLFDYERELGVAGKTVWGVKKAKFNGLDFGALVVSTYAAPAS